MPTKQNKKPTRSPAVKQPSTGHPGHSISLTPAWKQRLKELAAFKKKHGHCRVSTLDKKHASLGNWVRTQRGRRKQGQLSQEQIRTLDELRFSWDARSELAQMRQARWESMYEALVAYQRTHGHCRVPFSTRDHSSLAHWTMTQRCARREGKLSAEQVRRLDELGFPWDVLGELEQMRQAKWELMYEALVAHQRAHEHRGLPDKEECFDLWQWVVRQRVARREGKLSAEQIRRLDKLNIVGIRYEEQWERMLAALVEYKKTHGNCNVPAGWPPNPKLAAWVNTQRTRNTKGKLSPQHRERLEALGFRWSIKRTRRSSDQAPI